MQKFIEVLDKIIALENDAMAVKPRVDNTIGSAVKVLNAVSAADLGNTERAVVDRLKSITLKLQTLIG